MSVAILPSSDIDIILGALERTPGLRSDEAALRIRLARAQNKEWIGGGFTLDDVKREWEAQGRTWDLTFKERVKLAIALREETTGDLDSVALQYGVSGAWERILGPAIRSAMEES